MKAAIVGIQGVGMAHAIACERVGVEVVAVLDIDAKAEKRIRGPWINQWGPYKDTIMMPRSNPVFTTDPEIFRGPKADILIIATPTATHIPLLKKLGDLYERILVEKPLSYSMMEIESVPAGIRSRTWVGHKWTCHPEFPPALPPEGRWTLKQGHNFPPDEQHKRQCGVIWDLGVHAAAHYLQFVHPEKWKHIDVHSKQIEPDVAEFYLSMSYADAYVYVAYQPLFDGEVGINNKVLHWADLFDCQLRRLVAGTHPAPFALGAEACKLIGRIAPYHA